MVRLTKIYTRGGDAGRTSLGDGTRVSKTHWRIAAYGGVDELNAAVGVVAARRDLPAADRALLRRIQNDLFDLGADLCVPRRPGESADQRLRLVSTQVTALEQAIDARNGRLQALSSFILPGGTTTAAALHVARVVCRRAEVAVVAGIEAEPGSVGEHVLPYLNRLSDLFFVMARCANRDGRADVLWLPGAGRGEKVPAPKSGARKRGGRKPRRAARPQAGRGPNRSRRPGGRPGARTSRRR